MGIAGQQNMSFSAWYLRLAMVYIPPTSFDPFPPTGSYGRAPRLQESEAWGWQESKPMSLMIFPKCSHDFPIENTIFIHLLWQFPGWPPKPFPMTSPPSSLRS